MFRWINAMMRYTPNSSPVLVFSHHLIILLKQFIFDQLILCGWSLTCRLLLDRQRVISTSKATVEFKCEHSRRFSAAGRRLCPSPCWRRSRCRSVRCATLWSDRGSRRAPFELRLSCHIECIEIWTWFRFWLNNSAFFVCCIRTRLAIRTTVWTGWPPHPVCPLGRSSCVSMETIRNTTDNLPLSINLLLPSGTSVFLLWIESSKHLNCSDT